MKRKMPQTLKGGFLVAMSTKLLTAAAEESRAASEKNRRLQKLKVGVLKFILKATVRLLHIRD